MAKKNKQKQASQDTEFAADNAVSNNASNRIAQKNSNQQNR
ncbi:hypothetical protein [Cohnella yongneupensis]|uniref:Small, acid-soluble spore protein gamma-type n=1 Tax=Cohnella yongneupensis TaxID=425006 RepID=A0ABW0QYR1_9BACL